MIYTLQTTEIINANLKKLAGTQNADALRRAKLYGHPLLVTLDGLLLAARQYRTKWERPIAEEPFAGQSWLDAAKGVRGLFDWDFGPVDGGTLEEIFWRALEVAGFTEADL